MRVNIAAAASATAAALLAAAGHAEYPAQVVVSVAAGGAYLALLTLRGRATRSEWLTVRVLLAGNLIVFGASYEDQLGIALTATAILSGLGLLVAAIWAYAPRHRGRRTRP